MGRRRKALLLGIGGLLAALCILGAACALQGEGGLMGPKDVRREKFERYLHVGDFDFDFESAYEKGYSRSPLAPTKEYFALQDRYMAALRPYLSERLSLGAFDEDMRALRALAAPETDASQIDMIDLYYWTFGRLDSSYACLRNNIKVERLEREDADLLREADPEDEEDRGRLRAMVERTYGEVLEVHFDWVGEDEYGVGLIPGGSDRASNKAVVLWVVYQREFPGGEYTEAERAKRRGVEELRQKYGDIFTKELGREVVVFIYPVNDNDFL